MVGTKRKTKQKFQGEGRYGRFKSKKSLRMVFVKTPGGRTVAHFKKKKPSKHKCSNCGAELKGVPRERPYKRRTMPKSKKRPDRPFGGNLCSNCTRKRLIKKARK